MRKYQDTFIIIFIIFLLSYLACSFIEMSFNAAAWRVEVREGMMVCVTVAWLTMIILLFVGIKEN